MKRFLLIAAAIAIAAPLASISGEAEAGKCKFDWSKGAYCGPGGTARRAADEFFGPFSNACRTHDFCYFAAGEQIAKEIGEGYLKSRSDLRQRQSRVKRQCDSRFSEDLSQACSQVSGSKKKKCKRAARAYAGLVIAAGGSAFKQSIARARNCR